MATSEKETAMDTIGDPKDYREAKWKVKEKTGAEGTMEMHLRTKQRGKWRNKHRILAVVCKIKPTPGVQLRTTSGSFLVSIANAVMEGMTVELKTAIETNKETKKKRTAFCSKLFFIYYFVVLIFFCSCFMGTFPFF